MNHSPESSKPKPRRWLHFSLRTLLLLTVVLVVWLAITVNKAHKQQAAVAAIEEAGGTVLASRQAYPAWFVSVLGEEYTSDLPPSGSMMPP